MQMFAQIYHAMYLFAYMNGPIPALLVFSLLSALGIYAFSLPISWWFRKQGKALGLPLQLGFYFGLILIGWVIFLIIEGSSLGHVLAILKPAVYGLVFYIPAWLLYNYVMVKWPKLPWMIVQLFFIWLAMLVLWGLLIYYFEIFPGLVLLFQG